MGFLQKILISFKNYLRGHWIDDSSSPLMGLLEKENEIENKLIVQDELILIKF